MSLTRDNRRLETRQPALNRRDQTSEARCETAAFEAAASTWMLGFAAQLHPRGVGLFLLPADEPRCGEQEQRRQEHAEERVDPDQCDVEAAEAESDPEGAEWSVRFQGVESCDGNAGKISEDRGRGKPGIGMIRFVGEFISIWRAYMSRAQADASGFGGIRR